VKASFCIGVYTYMSLGNRMVFERGKFGMMKNQHYYRYP
jgi:hypothetical protein